MDCFCAIIDNKVKICPPCKNKSYECASNCRCTLKSDGEISMCKSCKSEYMCLFCGNGEKLAGHDCCSACYDYSNLLTYP